MGYLSLEPAAVPISDFPGVQKTDAEQGDLAAYERLRRAVSGPWAHLEGWEEQSSVFTTDSEDDLEWTRIRQARVYVLRVF